MALDDIIKYGKKALIAEEYRRQYVQDNSLNAMTEAAKWEGLDRIDPTAYSALEEASLHRTAVEQRKTLDDYIVENTSSAVREVQADVPGTVNGITKDEVLHEYVMQVKPVEYDGSDEEVLKAHKGAFEARRVLKNNETLENEARKRIPKILDNLKDKKVNAGLIDALARIYFNDPRSLMIAVHEEFSAKIGAFNKIERSRLTNYVLGRYNSLSDNDKASEAYEIAKAVAVSN